MTRRAAGDDVWVKLELVQVGWKLLGNHPLGVVDLQQIAVFAATIAGTSMPHFAPEHHDVTSFAEDALFSTTIPFGIAIRTSSR